ncbi:hypothetical protein BDN67DRAFT_164090 [Paxillus ammoniavirescens]|nr:hypothetical protein BDN67DRAFT_164090 [Paxillus ammoniavirescens]
MLDADMRPQRLEAFFGTALVPGPVMVRVSTGVHFLITCEVYPGTVLCIIGMWTLLVFLGVADRESPCTGLASRRILAVLLVMYIPTMVLLVAGFII